MSTYVTYNTSTFYDLVAFITGLACVAVAMKLPVKRQATEDGSGPQVRYGVAAMQGWREEMEDVHLAQLSEDQALLGVFDGHGGEAVAKLVAQRLPQALRARKEYREGNYEEKREI